MPTLVRPPYKDAFNPLLLTPPIARTIDTNAERALLIREVIRLSSSDSKFAEKAWTAILYILTGAQVIPPAITGLIPNTAALGSPSFTLHVHGTGFTADSTIVWNGSIEPTTYVSATELTTLVDMSTAQVAIPIPVLVQLANGAMSNTMTFTLTPASAPLAMMGRGIITEKPEKKVISGGPFTEPHQSVISKEPKIKEEK